jgi:hypothetical protein
MERELFSIRIVLVNDKVIHYCLALSWPVDFYSFVDMDKSRLEAFAGLWLVPDKRIESRLMKKRKA